MPCICQYFSRDKNKKCSHVSTTTTDFDSRCINLDSSVQQISSGDVSASEISTLRAEVWTLKATLSETENCAENMQDLLTNVVQEKYELIDELNKSQNENYQLKCQHSTESELHAAEVKDLLNQIYYLKGQLDEKNQLFDQIAKQNIELKQSLHESNDTIYRMGLMFLKMKNTKNSIANYPAISSS